MAKNLVNGANIIIEDNGSNINMNLSNTFMTKINNINNYNTQEIVVGELLGKPLYRKIVTLTTTNNSDLTTRFNVDNFDKIYINNGISFIDDVGEVLPVNWYYGSNDWCRTWLNKTNKSIRFRSPSSLGTRTVYVVLEYTKN